MNDALRQLKEVVDLAAMGAVEQSIENARAQLVISAVELDHLGKREAAHRVRFALLAIDDAKEVL